MIRYKPTTVNDAVASITEWAYGFGGTICETSKKQLPLCGEIEI
jgi:hypothetical protein